MLTETTDEAESGGHNIFNHPTGHTAPHPNTHFSPEKSRIVSKRQSNRHLARLTAQARPNGYFWGVVAETARRTTHILLRLGMRPIKNIARQSGSHVRLNRSFT
jgi:predicted RNA binding protein YcfA (HicA-like mRNA interferase family)